MMVGFKHKHLIFQAPSKFLFLFKLSVSILLSVVCSFPVSTIQDECWKYREAQQAEEWLKRKIEEEMQFIEKTFKNLSFEVFVKYKKLIRFSPKCQCSRKGLTDVPAI